MHKVQLPFSSKSILKDPRLKNHFRRRYIFREIMTDRPTNQPTNKRTWGFKGKLHKLPIIGNSTDSFAIICKCNGGCEKKYHCTLLPHFEAVPRLKEHIHIIEVARRNMHWTLLPRRRGKIVELGTKKLALFLIENVVSHFFPLKLCR